MKQLLLKDSGVVMIKDWARTRIQSVLSCGRSSSPSVRVVVTTALGTSPFLPVQQSKPAQLKAETQNFASWTLWCLGGVFVPLILKMPSSSCWPLNDSVCFSGTVAAQMKEWLITNISCSPGLNVSAWPQNQLWKTRCFFNYLKDSEDKQPDLVSSLIWIEKYTLLCSPDERTEHLQPAKCCFLIPLTRPGLKTSTWLEWDCVLAEINTLEIETKKKNLLMCIIGELFINEWNFKAYSRYCCLPSKDKKKLL